MADRLRRVGAVDAIYGGAEIHGACAKRIARSTGHEARQVRLALDHFRWRMPIRPFRFTRYLQQSGPGEAVAADADAVAQRPRLALDQIKMPVGGVDDDSADRMLRAVEHGLALILIAEIVGRIAVVDAGRGFLHCRREVAGGGWPRLRPRWRTDDAHQQEGRADPHQITHVPSNVHCQSRSHRSSSRVSSSLLRGAAKITGNLPAAGIFCVAHLVAAKT